MGKVFRVTAGDPAPSPIPAGLLGDWPYLGVGESGEGVYGVYGGPSSITWMVCKVRGTERWAIGASWFTGGPPPAAWPPPILYGDLGAICLGPSGWDGGVKAGGEPPDGDYQRFQAGSYREEYVTGELLEVAGSSGAGWFPWCCMDCAGSTPNEPLTICHISQGPVPDFHVSLLNTTPGETTLTGDYRAYGFACAAAGLHTSWSPVLPANCWQVTPTFSRSIGGKSYQHYLEVSLNRDSLGAYLQVRLMRYLDAAWTAVERWKNYYPSAVDCRAWDGERILNVLPGRDTDFRCYLAAVDWAEECMP